ncbi:4-aminobutyrate aminotransferase [Mycobacterium colombiense]|uniref:4-aminobutyrate aminotransferase n=1 Tax=Mycobacterium colombiense TaxID=339268 RepID=A0A329K540_9MYCO|nr:4-aminobutyrate aminotransferase [Mycobacterium colombiense]
MSRRIKSLSSLTPAGTACTVAVGRDPWPARLNGHTGPLRGARRSSPTGTQPW